MKEYNKTKQDDGVLRAINIQWDVDEEDGNVEDLPNEVIIPNGICGEEEISDYLSDLTGFCHKGFDLVGPSDQFSKES